MYDASYWYNRNLAIIANIERQFLKKEDLKNIHYYFGKHRSKNVMLTHLQIQYALGLGLAVLVLLYHFFTRIVPGFDAPWKNFEFPRALPYVFTIIAIAYLKKLRDNRNKSYAEFIENSPGITVDTSDISYGIGHGFSEKDQSK